jgi:hypothetical protein
MFCQWWLWRVLSELYWHIMKPDQRHSITSQKTVIFVVRYITELNCIHHSDLQEAALSSRSWRGESISLCRMWEGICIKIWNVWASATAHRIRGVQMPVLWQGVHGEVQYTPAIFNGACGWFSLILSFSTFNVEFHWSQINNFWVKSPSLKFILGLILC